MPSSTPVSTTQTLLMVQTTSTHLPLLNREDSLCRGLNTHIIHKHSACFARYPYRGPIVIMQYEAICIAKNHLYGSQVLVNVVSYEDHPDRLRKVSGTVLIPAFTSCRAVGRNIWWRRKSVTKPVFKPIIKQQSDIFLCIFITSGGGGKVPPPSSPFLPPPYSTANNNFYKLFKNWNWLEL